ncbi:hypothetical protein ACI6PS_08235 [Flavobacterium sp. PLA-1-15]|uniref:hypothetical protein n=1 Tax=Flavobacterium sp. PLA-1-15 TaxID=3380533 RepID=UPI003B7C7C4F
MKKTVIIMLLLCCSSIFSQVRISFRNDTGARLEDCTIGTLELGNIEVDSVYVMELPIEGLRYAPSFSFSGLYRGKKLTWGSPVRCGNGLLRTMIKEGNLAYRIRIRRDYKGEETFSLSIL